ncbi:glycosyltransferase [Balneatrix alpica]|uniref:Glycosyltransferase n=1 Tax=Balneatrix alpica TaxID=75684 RepID=A0ABV5ZCA6_9GAMM|nr:glycosyltransferase [Balneatrix alpica]
MAAISIIVITLNEAEHIANLLEDLCQQSKQDFEVVLVDSASTDATLEIAQQYAQRLPQLKIIAMAQRGASLGRNTGAQAAQHERLLFLDADVRLAPDFLARADWSLTLRPADVAAVYMDVAHASRKAKPGYALFNAGIWITQFFFPTAIGACLFSTRRAHQLIGGFNEQISLCEDCAYALAAHRHPQLRFNLLPLSFVFHPRRLEQDGYLRTGFTYLRANVRRFFSGELLGNPYQYRFGHYHPA